MLGLDLAGFWAWSAEVGASFKFTHVYLVVLGHEGCGAINAALETKYQGTQQRSRIQLLVDSILPALHGHDPALPPTERQARAVENNVRWTVRTIIESPEGQARAVEGRVKCVGAIYEIETGRVRFLEPSESEVRSS